MARKLTLMDSYHIQRMHDAGVTVTRIAKDMRISRQAVHAVLRGETMQQQRQKASRMEALLGGALGPSPSTGCSQRWCPPPPDRDVCVKDDWPLGPNEMTSPDPLDILIAEEEIAQRLQEAGYRDIDEVP